jgi:hypothetical protein
MVETSWPFVEWTEKIERKDVKRLVVNEKVIVGDDVVGNMGTLTRVEIFSSLFRPQALSIRGNRVRGIIAENREGEYFYHAFLENVREGDKLKLVVTVDGESTRKTLREDGYYSNFAWDTRHVQRIIFPRGWKILSATPNTYVIEDLRGFPSIRWNRSGKFRGDVQVKVKKAQINYLSEPISIEVDVQKPRI